MALISSGHYILIYLSTFFLYFIAKIIFFRRKYHLDPFAFLSCSKREKLAWLGLILVLLLYYGTGILFFFAAPVFTFPHFLFLSSSIVTVMGVIISLLGKSIVAIAHAQMGKFWRMGTDAKSTELLHRGFFAYSRNPVYLGLLMTGIGLLVLMKSILSLLLLTCLFVFLRLIISYEEEFLQKKFGSRYEEYKRKTRRFI